MTVAHRDYPIYDRPVADDPGAYARAHDLVGKPGLEARQMVGAWRWPLLHADKIYDKLRSWIAAADRIIDFGGAAGPLGCGSIVVDRLADIRGLEEVEGQVDLIFTAHTLEHVSDLGLVMCSFHWKLPPGGRLVALVPSWTKEMLRAENWDYHAQTFCLSQSDETAPAEYTRIDRLFVRHGFEVRLAAEGFDNIVLFAEKA